MSMTTELACTHYWKIQTPQGPTSMGHCHHCGETAEFKNVPDELLMTMYSHNRASRDARKRAGALSRERSEANAIE